MQRVRMGRFGGRMDAMSRAPERARGVEYSGARNGPMRPLFVALLAIERRCRLVEARSRHLVVRNLLAPLHVVLCGVLAMLAHDVFRLGLGIPVIQVVRVRIDADI